MQKNLKSARVARAVPAHQVCTSTAQTNYVLRMCINVQMDERWKYVGSSTRPLMTSQCQRACLSEHVWGRVGVTSSAWHRRADKWAHNVHERKRQKTKQMNYRGIGDRIRSGWFVIDGRKDLTALKHRSIECLVMYINQSLRSSPGVLSQLIETDFRISILWFTVSGNYNNNGCGCWVCRISKTETVANVYVCVPCKPIAHHSSAHTQTHLIPDA